MRCSLRLLAISRAPPTAPLPTAPYTPHRLPCTAPPTSSHLLLHLPHPPPSWPAKFPALPGVPLPPLGADVDASEMRVLYAWDGQGETPLPSPEAGLAAPVMARYFRPGKEIWEGQIDPQAADLMEELRSKGADEEDDVGGKQGGWDIYVCTHGTRDCRCSDQGGALVDGLREEIDRVGAGEGVRVWEISHLGGHKFAANALIFDHARKTSHLYGNLRPTHAPLILSALLAPESPSDYPLIPRELLPLWRGKTGMTKEEMKVFWVAASGSPPPPPEEEEEVKGKGKVEVVFETWQGEEVRVEGEEGESVMEVGKRMGLEAMEGVCGGVLECATCHCFIAPRPAPAPVPALSDEEEDMLVNAMMPKPESRLGCQIKLTPELGAWCASGGRIGLPRF